METMTSQELLMVAGGGIILVLSFVTVVSVRFKTRVYRRHPALRPRGRIEWAWDLAPMAGALTLVFGMMVYESTKMTGSGAMGWWVMTAVLAVVVATMLGLVLRLYHRFDGRDRTSDPRADPP